MNTRAAASPNKKMQDEQKGRDGSPSRPERSGVESTRTPRRGVPTDLLPGWLPDVGPVFGAGDEAPSHRVHANVISFLVETFVVAKPVVEESALPSEVHGARGKAFPAGNDLREIGFSRARDQCVEVIRHQQPEMSIPA